MREQPANERIHNFNEVPYGYSEEEAVAEATRCFNCKADRALCIPGCPVTIDIPRFIRQITERDFAGAYRTILENNSLPAVCGRVCPQEEQCQKKCIAGIKGEPISIGRLERFVADWAAANQTKPRGQTIQIPLNPPFSKGEALSDLPLARGGRRDFPVLSQKVAVIGSGPSGLTCAADLRRLGYEVTIFEALHEAGGVLLYGIPEFRLPKSIIKREVDLIQEQGVELYLNALVGKLFSLEDLMQDQGYSAVFVGVGAGLPSMPPMPGDHLAGVYSANEYLTRINMMQAYKFPEMPTPVNVGEIVGVMGGGNVAMDAARTSLRMGARESHIIYRRSADELPARAEEVHHAREEGIIFDLLVNPLELIGNEQHQLKAIKCIRMELGEPDDSGRRRPVVQPGSEFTMPLNTFIYAIGQSPNPILSSNTPALKTKKWGYIETNPETLETSIPGVYAGGDVIGGSTVIQAMGDGKRAAKSIHEYLKKL